MISKTTYPHGFKEFINASQQNDTILQWPVPEALETAVEVTYRNMLAENLSRENPADIARRYVYLSVFQMADLLRLAERHILMKPLSGVGIELGAGCGLLASVVARKANVEAVFALELCQQMVRLNIPKVARHVLGNESRKVIPVIGSFDDLRLPDASLDFAVEIDSLHHSHDLPRTLIECARVLKPGGVALCFDRCHPDSLSDEKVEEMLSTVYSREFLVSNSYPPDVTLTRRDNGEHEYRRFEWQAAFDAAGLQLVKSCRFTKRVPPRAALKGALSILPESMQRKIHRSEGVSFDPAKKWVKQRYQRLALLGSVQRGILAPIESTVFLLQKSDDAKKN